jgi:hypothetical protein
MRFNCNLGGDFRFAERNLWEFPCSRPQRNLD